MYTAVLTYGVFPPPLLLWPASSFLLQWFDACPEDGTRSDCGMRWGCAMGGWTLTIAGAHFTLGSLYHVELYRWRRQDEDDPSTATAVPTQYTQPAEGTKEGTREGTRAGSKLGSKLVRLLRTKAVVATSTTALDVEMPPLGPLGVLPGGGYLRTRIYLFQTQRATAVTKVRKPVISYTLYTPFIHLYCRICTYVHPLYFRLHWWSSVREPII